MPDLDSIQNKLISSPASQPISNKLHACYKRHMLLDVAVRPTTLPQLEFRPNIYMLAVVVGYMLSLLVACR